MIANDPADVVVESPREIEGVGWFCPITEHHRHSREHLHGNAVAVAFLDTPLRVPYVVSDLAEDAIANHHPRAARLIMIKTNESAVAVLCVEVGPVARQNVSVDVDLHLKRRKRPTLNAQRRNQKGSHSYSCSCSYS